MTQILMDMLRGNGSTIGAYEPKNFEGSPMYKFQKEQGMKDLEKLMAARGLTGSGAEIQANSDFLAQLNASEAEKQRQYAQSDVERRMSGLQNLAGIDLADRKFNWDRSSSDLDRAMRQQEFLTGRDFNERRFDWEQKNTNIDRANALRQFEANRSDQAAGRNSNVLLGLLELASRNPIADQSYKGTAEASQYSKALTDALAAFTANNYTRQIPSGGGGAGLPPPQPGNSSGLDIAKLMMDYGNSADNQGFWGTILSQLAR